MSELIESLSAWFGNRRAALAMELGPGQVYFFTGRKHKALD